MKYLVLIQSALLLAAFSSALKMPPDNYYGLIKDLMGISLTISVILLFWLSYKDDRLKKDKAASSDTAK